MLKFMTLSRKQRILSVSLATAIILAIIYAAIHNNIHTVIPNEVYRSAQLSPSAINRIVHLKSIKSIINLRGANPTQPWYRDEIAESKALHLNHYDIALNSQSPPTQGQLLALSSLLLNAPKPILLHCKSGIDRSGFVSAMALILLKNAPLQQAMQQFSWHYLVTSHKSVGKLVFNNYQQWLSTHHRKNNKENFIAWVKLS